ncbi:MAG: hypothetical protein ACSHXY_02375 [Alphaproteobacteria bacterium]
MSTLENCKARISNMLGLLQEETALLNAGQLDGLVQMSARKVEAMSLLDVAMSEIASEYDRLVLEPRVEKIRRVASENGVVLKSVMNGVKSARDRLRSLQHSNAKIGAYNRAGTRLFLSEDQIFSEKRI